jgi:hypothetical protein
MVGMITNARSQDWPQTNEGACTSDFITGWRVMVMGGERRIGAISFVRPGPL